ncbi:MAG: hypothetical protein IT406_03400 [Candidatus Yanofskybacteria bacterium]|nr:hypothetical protein [Candidatus Yanofskybacteria bacterium]
MVTINNKITGDKGELEVIKHVECPNCGRRLMLLPNSYPLYDVQCRGCFFRAQVKSTNGSKPHDVIRGAGWDIINKVLKSGALVPPLIVNFKWKEGDKQRQEIRFYPFIKKTNLCNYTANIKSRERLYKMFNYNLKGMKFYVLYEK